jgi:iron complex transport system substrate-binding protein
MLRPVLSEPMTRKPTHKAFLVWALALMVSTMSSPALAQARLSPTKTPERIISLMPALTETVCVLGACEKLLATDAYSDWPASVKQLPKLGAFDEISIEAIIRLRPDLVLAHPGGRLNPRLRSLGIPLVELPSDTLKDIHHALKTIGALVQADTGAGPSVDQIWNSAQQRLKHQARTLALKKPTRVYIEVDSALYAAGPNSYLGELLQGLGAENISPERLGAFPKLAPEFVLQQQPDIMMQMHAGVSPAYRPGWGQLKAIKAGKICQWDAEQNNVLLRPGPRLIEAIDLIAACLEKNKRAS